MSQGPRDFSKKLYPLLPAEKALLTADQLWHFQVEGKNFGPYSLLNLQEYLLAHGSYPPSTKVKNEQDNQWMSPHDSKWFERRQSSAPSGDHIKEDAIILLIEGNKKGPYQIGQIASLLATKEILLTDYWSTSTYGPWKKIFEHPHFDRREQPAHLPEIPGQEDFETWSEKAPQSQSGGQELAQLIEFLRPPAVKKNPASDNKVELNAKTKITDKYNFYRISFGLGSALFLLVSFLGVYKIFFSGQTFPEITELGQRESQSTQRNRRPAKQDHMRSSSHPVPRPQSDHALNNQQDFNNAPADPADKEEYQEGPVQSEETYNEVPTDDGNADREVASESISTDSSEEQVSIPEEQAISGQEGSPPEDESASQ